jgi:uncharacterized protein
LTPRKSLIVLLDTNFLLIPIRFGIDIQDELGRVIEASFIPVITPAVIDELMRLLGKVSPSEEKEIRYALSFAKKITLLDDTLAPGEKVDDQLLRLAHQDDCLVATTDTDLRRKLREKGLPVVFLRQTRHLAIEGMIKSIS